jgi:hypothetical protein
MRQELPMATVANRVIWWFLLSAPITYLWAAPALQSENPSSEVLRFEFPSFVVLSLAIAGSTLILRKRKLVEPIRSGEVDLETPEGLGKAFTPFILSLVLSDAVAIFGVFLTLQSGNALFIYGFSAAAIGLLYFHRPTAPDLAASPNDV